MVFQKFNFTDCTSCLWESELKLRTIMNEKKGQKIEMGLRKSRRQNGSPMRYSEGKITMGMKKKRGQKIEMGLRKSRRQYKQPLWQMEGRLRTRIERKKKGQNSKLVSQSLADSMDRITRGWYFKLGLRRSRRQDRQN